MCAYVCVCVLSDPLDRLFESSPPFRTCQTDGIIVTSHERAVAERWVRRGGGRGEGAGGERGAPSSSFVFSHVGTDRSPSSPWGGALGGLRLMRGGMERRARGGVSMGRVMMSQQKLQQEENTEMVQHFFFKLWTAKS